MRMIILIAHEPTIRRQQDKRADFATRLKAAARSGLVVGPA